MRGIEDRLAAAGYVALLGNTDGDSERERIVFEQMRARHVDGFVLAAAHLNDPVLAESARADLPVVLMNRLAHDHSLPSVSVDNERGVRLAVAHLAGLGHQRIAHIAGPQEVSTGLARYRGFITAMEALGLPPDPELVVAAKAFSVEEGQRCTRLLLERRPRGGRGPGTAVVAANDMLALGCYAALDEAGLRCPEDLSVVGFNDMPFIDRLRPPLTTIRFPHYQVGREAAQLLLERIAGHSGPVKILFLAPELVIRGSTAPYGPAGQGAPAGPPHRSVRYARRRALTRPGPEHPGPAQRAPRPGLTGHRSAGQGGAGPSRAGDCRVPTATYRDVVDTQGRCAQSCRCKRLLQQFSCSPGPAHRPATAGHR